MCYTIYFTDQSLFRRIRVKSIRRFPDFYAFPLLTGRGRRGIILVTTRKSKRFEGDKDPDDPSREPSVGARRRERPFPLAPEQPPEIPSVSALGTGRKSKRGRDFPLQKKDIARVRQKGGFPPKQSGTTELGQLRLSYWRGALFVFPGEGSSAEPSSFTRYAPYPLFRPFFLILFGGNP